MKVTHIGTADNSGGAARAAFHVHTGLLAAGHESSMLVGRQVERRPEIDRIGFPETLLGKICSRAVRACETCTGLQYLLQPNAKRFLTHHFVTGADIIHLHNLHGNFFSFRILPALSEIAPLVWTLHDTWGLTGHCSYNYDCDRWKSGCGKCPNLREYPRIAIDTTALLWKLKQHSYPRSRLVVAAPSKWLASMARSSDLFQGCEVRCIPYGINLDEFVPGEQCEARDVLSIPCDAKVIMIVAFEDRVEGASRKGAFYFKQALQLLDITPRPWILAVGSTGVFDEFKGSFPVREVGYLRSPAEMRRCYAAADVFALPTLADNLPVSLIEAAATGTPGVGFDIGGVGDVLRHGETGYVAKYKDPEDFAKGIMWVLANERRRLGLSRQSRAIAEKEYSIELQVARYVDMYRLARETRDRSKVTAALS